MRKGPFVLILLISIWLPQVLFSGAVAGENFSPRVPGISLLFRIPLEDVSFYVRAGHPPDAFLAFSPDGGLLAVGTFLGRLIVTSTKDGRILWQKRIPEAMVKRVAFSQDGRTIYFGEQSPDGFIYAVSATDGHPRWRFRLADDLLPGTPPEKGDIYGIYRQPGCYRLKVLEDDDLLVLGIHSWPDKKRGYWRRLSRVYRLSPSGRLRWAWPREGPAELSLIYADSDKKGLRVAVVSTLPSDQLPPEYPYTPGTIYVLDGQRGKEVGRYRIPPLRPYYDRVSVWESVAVDPQGEFAVVATSDGRGFIIDLKKIKPSKILALGTPIMVGGLPVSAMSSYSLISPRREIYFQTDTSSIPYGLNVSGNRPAGPHPNANTIWAVNPRGHILWRFSAPFRFQGLASDARGKVLATAAGASARGREASHQYGVFVFKTTRPGGGLEKLIGYYPTRGPVFFHLALSPDGNLLALCETPYLDELGRQIGSYQVHVLKIKGQLKEARR